LIGPAAFTQCRLLASIDIPKRVKIIGAKAFAECEKLVSVTFEAFSKIKDIGEAAFSAIPLRTILLPANLRRIGMNAFQNCSLQQVLFEDESKLHTISHRAFAGTALRRFDGDRVRRLKWIGVEAFAGVPLRSLELPQTIEVIDKLAFEGCRDLAELHFVGREGQVALQIREKAFQGCVSLLEVLFPSSLSIICDYSFAGCDRLRAANFGSVGSGLYLGKHSFSGSVLASVTLSNSLRVIEAFCFERTGLTAIEVPSSVCQIAEAAFIKCQRLMSVTFGSQSELKGIQREAFSDCPLQEITIPPLVTMIGYQAFYQCTNLRKLVFAPTAELVTIEVEAFCGCSAISSLKLPKSLTRIANRAFEGCQRLAEITMLTRESDLDTIGIGAFSRCAIVKVELPRSLGKTGRGGRLAKDDFQGQLSLTVREAFDTSSFPERTKIAVTWIG
jgi:hypothetical protein